MDLEKGRIIMGSIDLTGTVEVIYSIIVQMKKPRPRGGPLPKDT